MQLKEIVINDGADVKVHSVVYHIPDGKTKEPIFPGCVSFKNKLGGRVVTFCGTPKAAFTYTEAFAFLTESRKKQIADLLAECGENPVYYTGDVEMYFRAAEIADEPNALICAMFNLGLDPLDDIGLKCDREVKKVERLMPSGKFAEVNFAANDDGSITVDVPVGVMDPVVLKING